MSYFKMKLNFENGFLLVFIVSFLSYIIYITIVDYKEEKMFNDSAINKINVHGEIIDFIRGGKSAPQFKYEYFYNKKHYVDIHPIVSALGNKSHDYLESYVGTHYFVRIIKDKPQHSKLLLNKPVADTTQNNAY